MQCRARGSERLAERSERCRAGLGAAASASCAPSPASSTLGASAPFCASDASLCRLEFESASSMARLVISSASR